MSIISKLICYDHQFGFGVFYALPLFAEYQQIWNNKSTFKKKFYTYYLISFTGLLGSYYFLDNYCAISYVENYFDCNQPIYQISKQTQYILYSQYAISWIQYLFYSHKENIILNTLGYFMFMLLFHYVSL